MQKCVCRNHIAKQTFKNAFRFGLDCCASSLFPDQLIRRQFVPTRPLIQNPLITDRQVLEVPTHTFSEHCVMPTFSTNTVCELEWPQGLAIVRKSVNRWLEVSQA